MILTVRGAAPWQGETTIPDPSDKVDRPTVLFMWRLHPKKNVQGLLRAWAQVVADRPDAQLWVAGRQWMLAISPRHSCEIQVAG